MKKNKPDDLARFLHVRDALCGIQRFVEGYTQESFETDEKTFLATIKQVEIVGEAIYHVTKPIKEQYSHIPWQ
jgi:uncharacterized protein with HEPN domain